ncbi:25536_t:CDS:2 [Gigaspora margarita]|uniref:25536_t:CDS:1 n=1 Tax=Gigaspora margarita TaxID=4874 RepID=A0ABM8VYV0_GIGMA|nr:25536_t:CDS:2 [Gigaspora margarita]
MKINSENDESSNEHSNAVKLEKSDSAEYSRGDSTIRQRRSNNDTASQETQNFFQPGESLNYENITKIFSSGSEKLSSLEIPETNEMGRYRVIIRDLGVIMKKSDVVVQNGQLISEVLFGLDKEIQYAGDELEEFRHQAENFFWLLASEMKSISQEIEKLQKLDGSFINVFIGLDGQSFSNNLDNFIRERLKSIEKQIPGFQQQLKQVLTSIYKVQDGAKHAHEYLIDGEREVEQALKKHWSGVIIDNTLRRRAEAELGQVQHIIRLLREMAPSLITFENFLKEYRRKIQDVTKEVKGVPKKPSKEDIKYLKNAVAKLEEQHAKFTSAEKQLGQKPIDSYYFDEIVNSKNRDCIEFSAIIEKQNNVHLKKIRIWSSDMVNAIAFLYSDDTSNIYGTPGDGDPYDFDWQKGEKFQHIVIRIGSILYAIQFQTDRGRISDWRGGDKGNSYIVSKHDNMPFNGIHGSFSRQICSIGIL